MRLVDADAAYKAACEGADNWDGGCSPYRDDCIREEMDKVPAASPWRRVEEPPDMDEYVLAFDGDIVVMASFDGEKWWQHDTYESFIISPSYWMPLPEPPKEE